jgi:lipoate-protein ligase A
MLFIRGINFDPYFNIAAEEYLLKTFSEEIFMLWQNSDCLVVGKHQNALAEINLPFVYDKQIPVVRRLTGGGTVFHDKGNINFTFVKNSNEVGKMINFRKYAGPVLECLKALGLPTEFSPRNDIFIEGLKVSGNAEHVDQKRKRVLHHGTLLFKSDLEILALALKTDPERFLDKAVNSVRSQVTNIVGYLKNPITLDAFFDHAFGFVFASTPDAKHYYLTKNDVTEIEKLAEEKYRTWDWNFGYSPRYGLQRTVFLNDQSVEISLHIEKGLIVEIESTAAELPLYLKSITGLKHRPETLKSHFSKFIDETEELMWQLF